MTFFPSCESVRIRLQLARWRNANKNRNWRWYRVICVMTVLQFHLKEINSELRFCHRGPHKMLETECPGGFIAFEPLNISCLFYANGPDIQDINVSVSLNLCDKDAEYVYLDPGGNTDYKDISTLHRIFFEPADETDEPSKEVEMDSTVCVHSCFPEFIDPFIPEDFPMLQDKPTLSEEEKEQAQANYMVIIKNLFVDLVVQDEGFFDDDEDIIMDEKDEADMTVLRIPEMLGENIDSIKGKFTYIMKLLAQSLRITMLKCAPFIETNYMVQVLRVMRYFYDTNAAFELLDVPPAAFKKMYKHLKECESSTLLKVKLNGTQCGNRHTLHSIFFTDQEGTDRVWTYRRLPRSFRWGIYDPVVESAWAAVDFVHGLCFQPFYAAGNILYFHLYTTAMEALFPPVPIQTHWMNPVKLKSDHEFWNTIMDTNDIQNQVRNLDACAISAYMTNLSPYMDRLLRPFVKEAQLRTPEYINFTPAGIGWKKSSDEYWRWYESVGGFKEISKNFGYCLDGSRENFEDVERKLKEKGKNC